MARSLMSILRHKVLGRCIFYGGLAAILFLGWAWVAQPVLPVHRRTDVPAVSPGRLEAHVRMLAENCRPRDSEHTASLDRAAGYIADELRQGGGRVEAQPFTANRRRYQNVVARYGPEAGPRIIIGAHYDSYEELPAADDNASGVAGLIELGRLLGLHTPARRVELVAYALEEPPYFSSDLMGSAVHAQSIKDSGAAVAFMASLEMIGFFSDEEESQHLPSVVFRLFAPDRGDFIAVIGRLRDGALVHRVKKGMRRGSTLPVVSIDAPTMVTGVDLSDHLSYWKRGFPAVMITDTAFLRNQNYHTAQDTPDTLDYRRMAMVVQDVYALVQER